MSNNKPTEVVLESTGLLGLRDRIAIAAMNGIASRDYKIANGINGHHSHRHMNDKSASQIAKEAYAIADAMLKEREKFTA